MSFEGPTDAELAAVVSQVATTHAKFAPADIREVLLLVWEGRGWPKPSAEWLDQTADRVASGDIAPGHTTRPDILELMKLDDASS